MDKILSPHRFIWSALRCDVLRALWNTGMSASRIGNEMKISKNSVIGKAHRMKLPPRKSPIPVVREISHDLS